MVEGGHGHDKQGRGSDEAALQHYPSDDPRIQHAGDEQADEERVEHRHRRSLGGREQPREDAADDDGGHGEHRRRLPQGAEPLDPALWRVRGAVATADGEIVVGRHQGDPEQEAWDNPRQEQARHSHPAVAEGVDHHDDRGGDDRPDGGGGRGERGGVVAVVSALLHHAHLDRPGSGGIREGGAADAGEEHRGEHVHVAQAAPDVTDETIGEAKQRRGDPTGGHEVGGEDEERHGHQGERVDSVEEPLRDGQERELALPHEGEQPRPAHGKGERQSGRHPD
jgi:hypothetical protein